MMTNLGKNPLAELGDVAQPSRVGCKVPCVSSGHWTSGVHAYLGACDAVYGEGVCIALLVMVDEDREPGHPRGEVDMSCMFSF